MSDRSPSVEIDLNAVIVTVAKPIPLTLVINAKDSAYPQSLPFGPFDPLNHRTFEIGLRSWVEAQTALQLGYVEQLYTFGDRGRHALPGDSQPHIVSVGYLALTRKNARSDAILSRQQAEWRSWYDFFPWEDWRQGRPTLLDKALLPFLTDWAEQTPTNARPRDLERSDRLRLAFGIDGAWDEERVLDRYELLYEAGLFEEAKRDGRPAALQRNEMPYFGRSMQFDHRRILATAISRLRAKLKYRPVVFELMPAEFTLTDLQQTVEAVSGRHLHKQNFRRLVENAELVEPTGATSTQTGGRPAALFRYRREIMHERPAPGLRVGGHVP